MQPLRLASLLAWTVLFAAQASLWLPSREIAPWWPGLLILLLLTPLRGLLLNRRQTFRWIGFLALFFFCIGISEMVANPDLRGYALATIASSVALFLASIYHARHLGIRARLGAENRSQ